MGIRSHLFLLTLALAAVSTAGGHPPAADFIRASCKCTRYPAVCMESLAAYAPAVRHSPRQLANAALAVSAEHARAASRLVSRLLAQAGARSIRSKDGGAIRDCLETLSDTIDRLGRSLKELRRMGRARSQRYEWHLSNAQTWVSAALTDETTCLDSLKQEAAAPAAAGYKSQIRKKVVEVAQVTSNALALVNRLEPRN